MNPHTCKHQYEYGPYKQARRCWRPSSHLHDRPYNDCPARSLHQRHPSNPAYALTSLQPSYQDGTACRTFTAGADQAVLKETEIARIARSALPTAKALESSAQLRTPCLRGSGLSPVQ
jgi:hypothetical protein